MPYRFLIYSVCLLFGFITTTSCSEENFIYSDSGKGDGKEVKGSIVFNLSTPDFSISTRDVNCEPGGSILIKNLWVGVFNATTGVCIGSERFDEFNQLLQSGIIFNKLIKVDFVTKDIDLPLAYIAAVANYDDVKTWTGKNISDFLPDFNNHSSITWDDIINLDIDTSSAYSGNKGENENSNAPFLAGFYQDATSQNQNPKIDQFSYSELGPSAIYPESAVKGMDIQLGDSNDDKIYVAAGALCLRRLISHNNIKLITSNGFEITEIKYRRFNMPRTVYLFQRRTDTQQYTNFEEWQKNSPNRADHLLKPGRYDYSDPSFPYSQDEDWIPVEINWWDDTEHVEFSFDHFENKHWGFGNLQNQGDREELNPDGTFRALCKGSQDSYNNFASYFILKLHIMNKSTGESAYIEYTLHEGFCNTDDGRRATTLEQKCRDFSSFRNVNYTYNINISGIEDIKSSVTAEEGEENIHPAGQKGDIWKMDFATGSKKTPVPIEGGKYNFNNKYLTFSDSPDLGFRIYGIDDQGSRIDICYNVPNDLFSGFAGIWPTNIPSIVDKIENISLPTNLTDGIKIGNTVSGYFDILEFIKKIQDGSLNSTEKFDIVISNYDGAKLGLKGNYMRGLYIFDRNDSHNSMDADRCSSYHLAYGAEQYPFAFQKIEFNPENIIWDNVYYKIKSKAEYLLSTESPIFYGAECSKIDLRWKHDDRILGYQISVFNENYTHPTITVGPDRLPDYLQNLDGETVFIYPLNTANFPRSSSTSAKNYNFSVTPIVDKDAYITGDAVTICYNMNGDGATSIRLCPTLWTFSSNGTNDWKNMNLNSARKMTYEVFYRGLALRSPTKAFPDQNYYNSSYVCLGGTGNTQNLYFSFWASVPGKFAVKCRSHSSTDPGRLLVVAKMSPEGSLINSDNENYDEVYVSGPMFLGTAGTFTTDLLTLHNDEPTEFRIYARGSIDYYQIQFIPSD